MARTMLPLSEKYRRYDATAAPLRNWGHIAIYLRRYALALLLVCSSAGVSTGWCSHSDNRDMARRDILVMHSAHKGYRWTDSIMQGLSDTLGGEPVQIESWIEYLDRKRAYSREYLNEQYELLQKKLGGEDFDVIVATGNEALSFLLQHRGGFFSDVPIVFCGVNGLRPEAISESQRITGVIERDEFVETIDLALTLHPRASQVVILAPGSANVRLVEQLTEQYSARVSVRLLRELHLFDIENEIASLGRDTILLPIAEPRTSDGRFLPLDTFVRRISAVSEAPVYAVWDLALGHGIVGGKLVHGWQQGQAAAEIVLEILGAPSGAALPPIRFSQSRFGFDHKTLERFGIDESSLPQSSIIVNRPLSFYEHHRQAFWQAVGIILALILFLGILLSNTIKRKRVEATLHESECRFRDAMEAATDWIWETDENLRFTFLSDRFSALTRIPPQKILGHTRWEVKADNDDREKWRQHRETLEGRKPFRDFVYRTGVCDMQGQAHYFRISGKPIYDSKGQFLGYRGTGADVTEHVEAEHALHESQRTLATLMGNLPGMAYRCRNDPRWTPEFLSSGTTQLTGYASKEFFKSTLR